MMHRGAQDKDYEAIIAKAEAAKSGSTDNDGSADPKPNAVTRTWFLDKYNIDHADWAEFFTSPRGMRLTARGNELLAADYGCARIDMELAKISSLAEMTMTRTFKFPWYMRKIRRTIRRPTGNIERRIHALWIFGDREAGIFLSLLDGDIERWAKAMTDSKIWRGLLHPLPDIDWDKVDDSVETSDEEPAAPSV